MTQTLNTNRLHGFTIVELLIVIVVIAILAAVSVVTYNGITQRANQQLASNELNTWSKLFTAYQIAYGSFPTSSLPAGNYCLGTGFTNGKCRHNDGLPQYTHLENSTESATIITELQKIGNPPMNTKKYTLDSFHGTQQGPYVNVVSNSEVRIHTFTSGSESTDCQKYNLEFHWIQAGSGDRILQCMRTLTF
jgi:prepilin-type N-terminal cleavage/methylation domain-containing protein